MTQLLGCLVALPFLLLLVAGLIVVDSFVVYKLWGWFVVPLFGLPALTLAYAYGLVLVFQAFQTHPAPPKEKEDQWWLAAFTRPVLYLAIGYTLHRWFL